MSLSTDPFIWRFPPGNNMIERINSHPLLRSEYMQARLRQENVVGKIAQAFHNRVRTSTETTADICQILRECSPIKEPTITAMYLGMAVRSCVIKEFVAPSVTLYL